MAVEKKRGCGYRKVGGLYMVSGNLGRACGRLPLELHVCPVCTAGIKQTRGWQWVKPAQLLADAKPCAEPGRLATQSSVGCITCPAGNLASLGEKCGLIWVGGTFYPEADDFMREAASMGVSRRIPAVPKDFKLGETWVLVAHPKAVTRTVPWGECTDEERTAHRAQLEAGGFPVPESFDDFHLVQVTRKGVITMFKPVAIEKIVTVSQSADFEAMKTLEAKGITPVVVPDDDPDHQGSVHAKQGPIAAAVNEPGVAPSTRTNQTVRELLEAEANVQRDLLEDPHSAGAYWGSEEEDADGYRAGDIAKDEPQAEDGWFNS